jgi:hypothetical protein
VSAVSLTFSMAMGEGETCSRPKREAMIVILIPFITCLGDSKSMSGVENGCSE